MEICFFRSPLSETQLQHIKGATSSKSSEHDQKLSTTSSKRKVRLKPENKPAENLITNSSSNIINNPCPNPLCEVITFAHNIHSKEFITFVEKRPENCNSNINQCSMFKPYSCCNNLNFQRNSPNTLEYNKKDCVVSEEKFYIAKINKNCEPTLEEKTQKHSKLTSCKPKSHENIFVPIRPETRHHKKKLKHHREKPKCCHEINDERLEESCRQNRKGTKELNKEKVKQMLEDLDKNMLSFEEKYSDNKCQDRPYTRVKDQTCFDPSIQKSNAKHFKKLESSRHFADNLIPIGNVANYNLLCSHFIGHKPSKKHHEKHLEEKEKEKMHSEIVYFDIQKPRNAKHKNTPFMESDTKECNKHSCSKHAHFNSDQFMMCQSTHQKSAPQYVERSHRKKHLKELDLIFSSIEFKEGFEKLGKHSRHHIRRRRRHLEHGEEKHKTIKCFSDISIDDSIEVSSQISGLDLAGHAKPTSRKHRNSDHCESKTPKRKHRKELDLLGSQIHKNAVESSSEKDILDNVLKKYERRRPHRKRKGRNRKKELHHRSEENYQVKEKHCTKYMTDMPPPNESNIRARFASIKNALDQFEEKPLMEDKGINVKKYRSSASIDFNHQTYYASAIKSHHYHHHSKNSQKIKDKTYSDNRHHGKHSKRNCTSQNLLGHNDGIEKEILDLQPYEFNNVEKCYKHDDYKSRKSRAKNRSQPRIKPSQYDKKEFKGTRNEIHLKKVKCYDVGTSTILDNNFQNVFQILNNDQERKKLSTTSRQKSVFHVKKSTSRDQLIETSIKTTDNIKSTMGFEVKGIEPPKKLGVTPVQSKLNSSREKRNGLECKVFSVLTITPGQFEKKMVEEETLQVSLNSNEIKMNRLHNYYKIDKSEFETCNQFSDILSTYVENPRNIVDTDDEKPTKDSSDSLSVSKDIKPPTYKSISVQAINNNSDMYISHPEMHNIEEENSLYSVKLTDSLASKEGECLGNNISAPTKTIMGVKRLVPQVLESQETFNAYSYKTCQSFKSLDNSRHSKLIEKNSVVEKIPNLQALFKNNQESVKDFRKQETFKSIFSKPNIPNEQSLIRLVTKSNSEKISAKPSVEYNFPKPDCSNVTITKDKPVVKEAPKRKMIKIPVKQKQMKFAVKQENLTVIVKQDTAKAFPSHIPVFKNESRQTNSCLTSSRVTFSDTSGLVENRNNCQSSLKVKLDPQNAVSHSDLDNIKSLPSVVDSCLSQKEVEKIQNGVGGECLNWKHNPDTSNNNCNSHTVIVSKESKNNFPSRRISNKRFTSTFTPSSNEKNAKTRSLSAECENRTTMFLTKTYKNPMQISAYQKRKQYDSSIRSSRKKRSLSENNEPKPVLANLVYEVRFFNVLNQNLPSLTQQRLVNFNDKKCVFEDSCTQPNVGENEDTSLNINLNKTKRVKSIDLQESIKKAHRIQELISENLMYFDYTKHLTKSRPNLPNSNDRNKKKSENKTWKVTKRTSKPNASNRKNYGCKPKCEPTTTTTTLCSKKSCLVKEKQESVLKVITDKVFSPSLTSSQKVPLDPIDTSSDSIPSKEFSKFCTYNSSLSKHTREEFDAVKISFDNTGREEVDDLEVAKIIENWFEPSAFKTSDENLKDSSSCSQTNVANILESNNAIEILKCPDSSNFVCNSEKEDFPENINWKLLTEVFSDTNSEEDATYVVRKTESLTTLNSTLSSCCGAILKKVYHKSKIPRYINLFKIGNTSSINTKTNCNISKSKYKLFPLKFTSKSHHSQENIFDSLSELYLKPNSQSLLKKSTLSLPIVSVLSLGLMTDNTMLTKLHESCSALDPKRNSRGVNSLGGYASYQKFVIQNNPEYSYNVMSEILLAGKNLGGGEGKEHIETKTNEIVSKNDVCKKKSIIEIFKFPSMKKSSVSLITDTTDSRSNYTKNKTCTEPMSEITDQNFFSNFHQIMKLQCQKFVKKALEHSETREDYLDEYKEIPLDVILRQNNLKTDELIVLNEESNQELGNSERISIKREDDTKKKSNNLQLNRLRGNSMQNLQKLEGLKKSSNCDITNTTLSIEFYSDDCTSMETLTNNNQYDSLPKIEDVTVVCDETEPLEQQAVNFNFLSTEDLCKQTEKQFFDNLLAFYDKGFVLVKNLFRDDQFFTSQIETIRNSDSRVWLPVRDDLQRNKKRKLSFRKFFKKKSNHKHISETNNYEISKVTSSQLDGSLTNFANSLSGRNTSVSKETSSGPCNDLEDFEKELNEKLSFATNAQTSDYLQSMAGKAKTYLEPLVRATISNRQINDKIKLSGFLKLLEMIEDGDFTFLTLSSEKSLEEKLKEHVAEMFDKVYKIADREVYQKNLILDNDKINLLKILVTKYHMGIPAHINILAIYIGRGLITHRTQLEDAILYLMRLSTAEINIENFEKNCGIYNLIK